MFRLCVSRKVLVTATFSLIAGASLTSCTKEDQAVQQDDHAAQTAASREAVEGFGRLDKVGRSAGHAVVAVAREEGRERVVAADEGIIGRHAAVVADAHDLAEVRGGVLRTLTVIAVADRDV